MIRDSKISWLLKIVVSIYQIPATAIVFYSNTLDAGRSPFFAFVAAASAVVLIDVLLIASLYFMESSEISLVKKVPWAFSGILTVAAVMVIGIKDEGFTAWMPRIAVCILVGSDIFNLLIEYLIWTRNIDRRMELSKQKRSLEELRIANEQVVLRRKVMKVAYTDALKALKSELLELHIQRERRNLGISEEPKTDQLVITIPKKSEELMINETAPQQTQYAGVYDLFNGYYGWSPNGPSSIVTHSKTGKPYSLQGAKIARSRHES
jgi:hypothetical protein